MTDFIDIEEAIQMTGSSDSTVRRWLRQLTDDQRERYVRKDGRKLVIDKSFLQRSFHLTEEQLPGQAPTDLVKFQQQQLEQKDKQIERLQDQNDKLLTDLQRKDEDLKSSWSLIRSLQDENSQLTGSVKALQAAEYKEESVQRKYSVFIYILLALVVVIVIYILMTL